MKPLILLVEDEPDTSALYRAMLTGAGMELACCRDTKEACEWWHGTTRLPDLLILDMRLPDGDGLDLCQRIKSVCDACPPVLILSAHGDPTLPQRCREAGAQAFLDKLKHLDQLVSTVQSLLAAKQVS